MVFIARCFRGSASPAMLSGSRDPGSPHDVHCIVRHRRAVLRTTDRFRRPDRRRVVQLFQPPEGGDSGWLRFSASQPRRCRNQRLKQAHRRGRPLREIAAGTAVEIRIEENARSGKDATPYELPYFAFAALPLPAFLDPSPLRSALARSLSNGTSRDGPTTNSAAAALAYAIASPCGTATSTRRPSL